MNKIELLISEQCPNGVRYLPLSEVTILTAGARITKSMMDDTFDYPVMGGGVAPSGKYTNYNFEHSVTISRAGSAGYVNWVEGKFWATDVCFVSSQKINSVDIKFVYHYVKMKQAELQSKIYGGNMPKLDKNYLWNLPIPIPPEKVQHSIVNILDKFMDIEYLLQKELIYRKKEYEEYLEILIENTLYPETKKIKLKEIFNFRNGLSKGKEYFGRGIPFIRYTDVYNNRFLHKNDIDALVDCTDSEKTKLKVKRGDVFFTRTSETAEDVGWTSVMLDDMDECVFNGFTIKGTPQTDDLLPEYCAYCFSVTEFRKFVSTHCSFTTRASLTGNTIGEYVIKIPPIDIQKRIVDILDRMHTICFDSKYGIPAEIQARRKQYEYYRNLLLDFKEASA